MNALLFTNLFPSTAEPTRGLFNLRGFAALASLWSTPLGVANTALSSYLVAAALGVLVGGYVAMRTTRAAQAFRAQPRKTKVRRRILRRNRRYTLAA